MRSWATKMVLIAGFVIVVLMSGCGRMHVDAPPVFLGTFVGHVKGEGGIQRELRIETVLESLSEFEYSFSGEAYLEGVRYTIEGTEVSFNGQVHYQNVSPQAAPPIGILAATFTDSEGAPRYELDFHVDYFNRDLYSGFLVSQEEGSWSVHLEAMMEDSLQATLNNE